MTLNQREWLLERAPARNGPWRYVKSLRGDIYQAIRVALELRPGLSESDWLRLVPEGRVQNAQVISCSD